MSDEVTMAPHGSGRHPIARIHILASDLAASRAFYTNVFGWGFEPVIAGQADAVTPAGPGVSLRGDAARGEQGTVVSIAADDVDDVLARVMEAGGAAAATARDGPSSGRLASFRDPWGTRYGLVALQSPAATPRIPVPFGDNPKPPDGSVCSLELHAGNLGEAARFFGGLFGWGTQETMPQYLGFDPGAGVGGVFQSHTPAMPVVAYLYASDVAATLSAIDAAGGTRMGEPMAMPGMATFGYFTDPSGTAVGLMGG